MKTKSYNVYSLAELTPKARQRAISDHAQFLSEQFDGETQNEDSKTCLAFAGFNIKEIYWSGFSSQGDGACFEGTWRANEVDAKGMKEHAPIDAELHRIADGLAAIAKAYPEASFTVKHKGHYQHKYCTDFNVSFGDVDLSDAGPYATKEDNESALDCGKTVEELRQDRANDDQDSAEKDLIELARDAMEWIYRQLEKDYRWHTEETQVIESIEANAYEFTVDGKID